MLNFIMLYSFEYLLKIVKKRLKYKKIDTKQQSTSSKLKVSSLYDENVIKFSQKRKDNSKHWW
jgi:ABC-type uncharacterized transport system permease subunit